MEILDEIPEITTYEIRPFPAIEGVRIVQRVALDTTGHESDRETIGVLFQRANRNGEWLAYSYARDESITLQLRDQAERWITRIDEWARAALIEHFAPLPETH